MARMWAAPRCGGALHDGLFVCVLQQAHFVQQRQQIDGAGGRRDAGARLGAHGRQPAGHACIELAAQRVVQRWRVGQQRPFLRPASRWCGGVEAEGLACAVRAIAVAVPDFAFEIFRAAEQDGARGASPCAATSTSVASGSVKPVR
jgi:hypothetical protein